MNKRHVKVFSLLILILTIIVSACSSDNSSPDNSTTKLENPVYESPLGIASDAAVIRIDNNTLHMYYTAENAIIGLVISRDNGTSWQHPNGLTDSDFAVLQGQSTKWDAILETVEVIAIGNEYWMYYTGYREEESDNDFVDNYQIGLAISTDGGLSFVRHPSSVDAPIIPINWLDDTAMDRHAITSPSVVVDNSLFYMVYTGWNTTNNFNGQGAGFWTIAATSSDGITWDKLTEPLLTIDDISWVNGSINESDMTLSPDGQWYFTFTTEEGIGLAISSHFTGPYTSSSKPLIVAEHAWEKAEVVAPNVMIETGQINAVPSLRIWYTGIENDTFVPSVVGYAETPYPFVN